MTRFVVHNHLPARRAADASRDAELNYSIAMKGWMFRVNGKNYGPFESEAKAQAALTKAKGGSDRDFRGVVNRDQEERNRKEVYDRHGIRRV